MATHRTGFFVTLEGVEGAGKTSQLLRLAARLEALFPRLVEVFREPGGTPLAEQIRAVFLNPADEPHAATEAFLLEASRSELVRKRIIPALDAGCIVLCDRYADSTIAYQGGGRGINIKLLRALNVLATAELQPHVTILLDLDPAEGLARKSAAPAEVNRLELENLAFHQKVRATFLEEAANNPERFFVVDASLSADEVEQRIIGVLDARIRVVHPGVSLTGV